MKRAPATIAGLAAVLFLITGPFILALQPARAQGGIEGQWTTMANGDDMRGLAMTGNVVWAGTHNGGVVSWDPFDGSHTQYLAPEYPLASNDIQAIASDGQYMLWFATRRGVTQFEPGEDQWITYTTADGLGSNNATAVAFGPDGKVWIGTSQAWDGNAWSGGGLSVCELSGNCVTYTVDDGLPSDNVTDIAFAGGDVWVGTRPYKVFVEESDTAAAHWANEGGGVAWLSGGSWNTFNRDDSDLTDNRINAVAAGPDGRIWFATPSGLVRYTPDEDAWYRYRTSDGLASNSIRDVTVDGDGRVWALTYKNETAPIGVLNMLEGDTWTEYGDNDGLSSKVLWAVLADQQGRIWVGTGPWCRDTIGCEGGGLTRYQPLDDAWQGYRTSESHLSSNKITDVAVTGDGTLWIATLGSGVSTREPNGVWQHFNMDNSDLSSNLVEALAVDGDGAVWIGTQRYVEEGVWTGGGLNVYRDGSWTVYDEDNSGLPGDEIQDIEVDADGVVWIGTGDLRDGSGAGLVAFDTKTNTWLPTYTTDDGLPSNVVTDVALDATGNQVWVATAPAGGYTGGGLAVFESGDWTGYTSPADRPGSGEDVTGDFRAVAVDGDGNPWAGTYNTQGFLSAEWPFVDALVAYRTDDAWSETTFEEQGYVSTLAIASNDNVWAGISHGTALTGLKPEESHLQPTRGGVRARIDGAWFAATADASGLAGSDVTALAFGSNGDVWIGTANAGLSLLQGAQPGPTPTNTVPPTDTPAPTNSPGPTNTPGPAPEATITPIPVTPTPGNITPPAEVPEAATLILVGTGLAGLGGYAAYRWRSRK
ncbi:MAG: hypothetical protein MAG451_00750 [Anaerolineales bacterium]|nr:hypothetical protein [Anaerolineales bacterium]